MKDYSREALLERVRAAKEEEEKLNNAKAQEILDNPDHPLWTHIDEQVDEGYSVISFNMIDEYEQLALFKAGTITSRYNIAYYLDKFFVSLKDKYFDYAKFKWLPMPKPNEDEE